MNPAQYEAHNALGSIMLSRGDLEQAGHHISEALRLQPGYEAAMENLKLLQAGFESADESQLRSRDM